MVICSLEKKNLGCGDEVKKKGKGRYLNYLFIINFININTNLPSVCDSFSVVETIVVLSLKAVVMVLSGAIVVVDAL